MGWIKSTIRNLKRIDRHFQAYRWYFLVVVGLSLVYSLLAGVGLAGFIPIFKMSEGREGEDLSRVGETFQMFFQRLGVEQTLENIFILILCLLFVRWIVYAASQFLVQSLIADYKKSTIDRLSEKLFRSKWMYFQNQSKGSILDYLTTRVVQVRQLFRIFSHLLVSYSVAFGYLLAALWISIPLTLGAILFSMVTVGMMLPVARRTKKISRQGVDSQNEISRLLSEYMNAFRELKVYTVIDSVMNRVEQQTERNARAQMKVGLLQKLSQETLLVLMGTCVVGGVYYALAVYNIEFARIGVVSFLFVLLFRRINKMEHVQRVAEYSPSINVLEEFSSDLEHEVEDQSESTETDSNSEISGAFESEIRVRGVSFSYPAGEHGEKQHSALEGINLTIRRGSMVSFVGKSGAGKSTLIGILLGLLEPDEGTVMIDGVPLHEIGLVNWRKRTGYVPQEPFLLNDTIETNISFFRDLEREAIQRAARMSYARSFIEDMPDGYQTVIGEEGVKLSGGQRQRLVFARAIAGRPDLLILDEATSELDRLSEEHIRQSLQKLRENMSIISVSHRLSSVIDSDCIFVLKNGNIVEKGTKKELVQKQGFFSQLHETP